MIPIKSAIIGLGRIGSSLEDDSLREKPASHAGAVSANPDTILVAGCDSDKDAREAFRQRWFMQKTYADATQMLRECRPEILHICTHEDSHLEYLALAIQEQVPVVVLEKPVSDSLSAARKLQRRLTKPGSPKVLVNHERRYSLDYRRVNKHILDHSYGELRSITGCLYMGRERALESMLLHDGTHLLDIIPFLTGAALKNLRIAPYIKGARSLFVTGKSGNSEVMLEVGNGRDHLMFELELSFSCGRIRVGNGIYEEWESRKSTFYEKMKSLYPVEVEPIGATRYFAAMLEDAVRVYRRPELKPVSSFHDGVESLALVQKIRRRLR